MTKGNALLIAREKLGPSAHVSRSAYMCRVGTFKECWVEHSRGTTWEEAFKRLLAPGGVTK